MKNLIVNIYKTLFFFDLSIVVVYYLPTVKSKNIALGTVLNEGIFLGVMLLFTIFFINVVEKRNLKVFNRKNIFRHYSLGLLSGFIPLGGTVLALWALKMLSFSKTEKISSVLLWLLALLLNAAANELLLRGYLFRLYRKYYNIITVSVVNTLLFISLNIYIFSGGVIYSANMILFNIMLCLLAEYSYSLLAPITARFIFTTLSGFLLGSYKIAEEYPVLINTAVSGKKLLSGGEMKLEGSIVMLIINLALCVFFFVNLKKRNKKSKIR